MKYVIKLPSWAQNQKSRWTLKTEKAPKLLFSFEICKKTEEQIVLQIPSTYREYFENVEENNNSRKRGQNNKKSLQVQFLWQS